MELDPLENLKALPNADLERFLAFIDGRSNPDSCWIWNGARNPPGYGVFRLGRKTYLAHRLCYELSIGPLDGKILHHKIEEGCVGPCCVNPRHLLPVTHEEHEEIHGRTGWFLPTRVNAACPEGHEYTAENTITRSSGTRMCRACLAISWAKRPLKTACIHGHEFTEANTHWYETAKGGWGRGCKACYNDRAKKYRKAEAAERAMLPPPPPREVCAKGHPLTPENTKIKTRAGRKPYVVCRECERADARAAYVAHPRPEHTHCKNGHELSESNVYFIRKADGTERPTCKTCALARANARYDPHRKTQPLKEKSHGCSSS